MTLTRLALFASTFRRKWQNGHWRWRHTTAQSGGLPGGCFTQPRPPQPLNAGHATASWCCITAKIGVGVDCGGAVPAASRGRGAHATTKHGPIFWL